MKLLLAIVLILSLLLTFPLTALAMYADYFTGDDTTTGAQAITHLAYRGFTFTPDTDFLVTNIKFDCNASDTSSWNITLVVKIADVNHKPTGSILSTISKTYASCTGIASPYSDLNDYDDFDIPDILLTGGTEYCIYAYGEDDGADIASIIHDSDSDSDDNLSLYSADSGATWSVGGSTVGMYKFAVNGTPYNDFEVQTQLPNWNSGNAWQLNGMVLSLGSFNRVNVGFEIGLTTAYGDTLNAGFVERARLNGTFYYVPNNLVAGQTYHYRAIAWSGTTYAYGSDKSFTMEAKPGIVTLLDKNSITHSEARIGALLVDLGEDSEVAVSIDYGLTTAYGSNNVFDATATEPDEWYTTLTGLDENTTYHIRAKLVGTESGTQYGKDISFTTSDSSNLPITTTIINFGNKIGVGSAIGWLIAILLLALIWLFEFAREHPFIGIIWDIVVIGTLLSLELLSIWIFVVLALIGVTILGITLTSRSGAN